MKTEALDKKRKVHTMAIDFDKFGNPIEWNKLSFYMEEDVKQAIMELEEEINTEQGEGELCDSCIDKIIELIEKHFGTLANDSPQETEKSRKDILKIEDTKIKGDGK